MALRALIIDFNSFFASVEQQEQPALRARPVVVVPVMTDSTCCIAASYEAKRFGIKTGTNVGDARKTCPGLVLLEARPELYVEYHHRLIAAVDSCLPGDAGPFHRRNVLRAARPLAGARDRAENRLELIAKVAMGCVAFFQRRLARRD
jgi:hypothetical protein